MGGPKQIGPVVDGDALGVGDVDITAQEVLVAIGRGKGSKDDVEVAEELVEALGAAVAGSRPPSALGVSGPPSTTVGRPRRTTS